MRISDTVFPHPTVGGAVPDVRLAVDLALPSGTLWAPWNVGSKSYAEPGAYFAWGETEADKRDGSGNTWYFWDNYRHIADHTGSASQMWRRINKYQTDDGQVNTAWQDFLFTGDGLKQLDPADDAATANWGPQWKTPTAAQFQELLDPENCKWEWRKRDARSAGYVVTSVRNGKSLFFLAAGVIGKNKQSNLGSRGYYMTSNLCDASTSRGQILYFNSALRGVGDMDRCCGGSVRAVVG